MSGKASAETEQDESQIYGKKFDVHVTVHP